MLNKKHRPQRKLLYFALLEACLEYYGLFKYKYLTHVFGLHNKEGIRIVQEYKDLNPGAIESSSQGITATNQFTREVLLKQTDPEHLLNLLYTLYGVGTLEDL